METTEEQIRQGREKLLSRIGGSTQMGGRGTIRRKKPRGGKRSTTDLRQSDEVVALLSEVHKLGTHFTTVARTDPEQGNDLVAYLSVFRAEYIKSVGKGHRRSNRVDHHTTLRERLADYLTPKQEDGAYHINEAFGTYGVKNLHDKALQQLTHLLTIYCEIVKEGEYIGFGASSVPHDDNALAEAYKILDFDFSVRMSPTGFRHHYLKRRDSSNDAGNQPLKRAYFSVLRLISGEDPDQTTRSPPIPLESLESLESMEPLDQKTNASGASSILPSSS